MNMGHEAAILRSVTGEQMTLAGVDAAGTVNGLLFELAVTQRYRNPSASNIEAVYTFPLPAAAVLLDLDVTIGGRHLSGVVVERKAAEAQYEEALEKGDTAIMLERAGNGLCTVNLGNLMAGEEATIRYRYGQLLRFQHGSIRLAVPTVIAPRYGDPAAAGLAPHQVPGTDLAAAYPFALSLTLSGAIAAGTIASPSHPIATARTADGVTVTLASGAALDRDFVLSIAGLPAQSVATVAQDGDGYVALASFCADVPASAAALPLRLKILLDCSGSMNGDSIEAARRALHLVFADLASADRFSFTRFGSTVVHEIDTLVAADPPALSKAAGRAAAMRADLGGTEMQGALQSVFALGAADGNAEGGADLLLITDGEVWGVDALVAEAQRARQRVFVVGIGNAPAEGLLHALAEATGGACEFVAPNEDAEAAILRMFARLRAPRIARAGIDWPQSPAWVSPLPRGLFGGETVHVWAGFDALPAGDVALRLVPADTDSTLRASTALPSPIADGATFARMAAAARLPAADAEAQLALALRYSLLTDRTNFIVIHARADGERAEALPELRKVAQMLAAGWGGVGSVGPQSVMSCMAMAPMPAPKASAGPSRKRSRPISTADMGFLRAAEMAPPAPHYAGNAYRTLLEELERCCTGPRRGTLPSTLAELSRLGIAGDVFDALVQRVGEGHAEADVVAAFLAALLPHATAAGASRQVLRALRNLFKPTERCAALRRDIATLVAPAAPLVVD